MDCRINIKLNIGIDLNQLGSFRIYMCLYIFIYVCVASLWLLHRFFVSTNLLYPCTNVTGLRNNTYNNNNNNKSDRRERRGNNNVAKK